MPEYRAVHEILYSRRKLGWPVVSFIQHGTSDDGFSYEVICPFCALTVGKIAEEPLDDFGPKEISRQELIPLLKEMMNTHRLACLASGFAVRVYKTRVPLRTEEKGTIQ